jgi:O-acetyl-ADP-ribose deacetylase (regulator of RNase III)
MKLKSKDLVEDFVADTLSENLLDFSGRCSINNSVSSISGLYKDPNTMIYNYTGSIFEAPTNVIIHQANCFHTMGTGIAKQIKDRYPEAYQADLKTDFADRSKLGTFSLAKVKDPKNRHLRSICNLYGQYHYGSDKCYTNYEALLKGFYSIQKQMHSPLVEVTVAVPYKIGCRNAGGDWNKVYDILLQVFGKCYSPRLLICKRSEDPD